VYVCVYVCVCNVRTQSIKTNNINKPNHITYTKRESLDRSHTHTHTYTKMILLAKEFLLFQKKMLDYEPQCVHIHFYIVHLPTVNHMLNIHKA